MKRRLPVVTEASFDQIDIATPCSADWNQMTGDARVRHCSECRLNVYNVAEMTRAEAATLIATHEKGSRTCVRLYRRADGTLLTQDCWARLRAARQRGWLAFAAALVIVGLTQLGLRFAALGWLIRWNQAERTPVSTPCELPIAVEASPEIVAPPAPEPHWKMGDVAAPPAPPSETKKKKQPKPPIVPPTHVKMGAIALPND